MKKSLATSRQAGCTPYYFSEKSGKGFTLIETMVAISLLTVAIVAPMMLTVQSLASAAYSRDQITAFYLAQEAIEIVHQIRDGQILQIAHNPSSISSIDLFGPIPPDKDFYVDARQDYSSQNIPPLCSGACPALQTDADGTFYGYGEGWKNTNFTRTVHACYVQRNGGTCSSTQSDEMRVLVTISWHTGAFKTRTFTMSEDLYRWVQDGTGA